MAFKLRNLSVLSYANGFTLWHYSAAQSVEVNVPGYFDDAADLFTPGSMIMVSGVSKGSVKMIVQTEPHVVLGEVE